MKATILDLRRRMKDILRALDQNEPVTILYRGKQKGIIYPTRRAARPNARVSRHPAFGMWKDRDDLADVRAAVRKLRAGRGHAL